MLVELATAFDGEVLKVGAAGIGSSAQHDQTPVGKLQVRLDRIETHVGIHRQRVGLVTLEGLARVLLGSRADVAALRVEHHRHRRVVLMNIDDEILQLVFGACRSEIGNLRLEGAGEIGGGIDDALAERQYRIGPGLQMGRNTRDVRVQPDAQQRIVTLPGGSQFGAEIHGLKGAVGPKK